MRGAEQPADEVDRLAQLRALALLDTDPEERFDRVTRLAQRLFDVPIALVSLVDQDRQWFKSRQGLDTSETPREVSFCAHAILGDGVFEVRDAEADPRFAENPLVRGAPDIRFYAGCPIVSPGGAKLGTLCIIDREPRSLTDEDARSLRDLADMVERELAVIQLATGDELTGLSNRRGFELLGMKLLDVCARRELAATLLYLDLDGMKGINDRFGHGTGDAALREFAGIIANAFRGSDVIARLGGDEFSVLLVGATDAAAPTARMRQTLEARNGAAGSAFRLDVSVGIAVAEPGVPTTLAKLVARADAAMYEDKRARGVARPQT